MKLFTSSTWDVETFSDSGCSFELQINGINIVIPVQSLSGSFPSSLVGKCNSLTNKSGRDPAVGMFAVLWRLSYPYFLRNNTRVTVSVLNGGTTVGSCEMWIGEDPVPLVLPSSWSYGNEMPVCLTCYDSRHMARMSDVNRAYNLIMPTGMATNSSGHLSVRNDYAYATLNDGVPYTVKEVVDDLFSKCCVPSGATASIDWDSSSDDISGQDCIPVRFHAVNAWDALNDVLDYYMLGISHDMFDKKYKVYKPVHGADRSNLTSSSVLTRHFCKIDDLLSLSIEPIYVGVGSGAHFALPEKIAVYSPSPMDRGNETPALRDKSSLPVPVWKYEHTCDWDAIDLVIGDTVIDGSVASVYDATPVELVTTRYDYASVVDADFELGSGAPTQAEVRAADVAEQFQWQLLASKRSGKVILLGCHTAPPYNDINSIVIRDYGDGLGMVTEFGTDPASFPLIRMWKEHQGYFRRSMLDPDFTRPLELQDMDVMQVVQVWDPEEDKNTKLTGLTPYGDMGEVFPGRMLRPRGKGSKSTIPDETDFELCWVGVSYAGNITDSDSDDGYGVDLAYARNGQVGLARLVGRLDVSNDVRPFYLIYQNMPQCALFIKFECADSFTTSAATFEGFVISAWSGADPGEGISAVEPDDYPRITIHNIEDERGSSTYLFSGTAGYVGIAVWDYVLDEYHCIQMRC